jgi:hypothetical protein
MVVVAQGHKTEGLKTRGGKLARRLEHLRHRIDGTRPAVKSYLYEIAGGELLLHLQQAAGYGNRLKFCARTLAALGMDGSRNGTIELYAGRTPVGVGLGEMGHSHMDYAIKGHGLCRLPKHLSAGVCLISGRILQGASVVCDNDGSNFLAFGRKSTFV